MRISLKVLTGSLSRYVAKTNCLAGVTVRRTSELLHRTIVACIQGVHKHPKKKYYRARAHSNPLNDAHFPVPAHPSEYDW